MNDPDLLFKALAHRSRRTLLDLLYASDGQTLGALCQHLDMTRQAVTQHLMRSSRLRVSLALPPRRGREKLHYLNPVPLQQLYTRWIVKFERPRLKALAQLKTSLEGAAS